MQLRRVLAVLTLSLLLSQQLLTQTPTQAPSSGSSAAQTSGAPHNDAAKAKCTDNGTYVKIAKGRRFRVPRTAQRRPRELLHNAETALTASAKAGGALVPIMARSPSGYEWDAPSKDPVEGGRTNGG